MSIYRRKGSTFYLYDFTVGGRRFRGSTEATTREVAAAVEARLRNDALLSGLTGRKPPLGLSAALARYWMEIAAFHASAEDAKRAGRRLVKGLGADTPLSDLDTDRLAAWVAKRRADRIGKRPKRGEPDTRRLVSNATVNRDIEFLRRVLYRADRAWSVEVAGVDWKLLLLPEAAERTRSLSAEEERRLATAIRADLWPLVMFAAFSGQRQATLIGLTWQQVDWDALTMTLRLKSKRPGGRPHTVPITPPMAAILQGERGRHPVYVFTYACKRNRHDRHRGQLQVKGARYPFTKDGWRREWQAALTAAGIVDFRFHDLRHTAATRMLAATGNLKGVQRMLGHAAIASTARYAHVDQAELRHLMERSHDSAAHLRRRALSGEGIPEASQEDDAGRAAAPKAGTLPG